MQSKSFNPNSANRTAFERWIMRQAVGTTWRVTGVYAVPMRVKRVRGGWLEM